MQYKFSLDYKSIHLSNYLCTFVKSIRHNDKKNKMRKLNIKLNDNLTLNGVIENITINKNELIINSNEKISWASAESIAKYLIKKGYKQISKITFKELITW